MRGTSRVAVLLGALVLCGRICPARGACNVVPDPARQLQGGPNPDVEAVALAAAVRREEAKHGAAFRYKGALGRIDRTFVAAGPEKPIRVAADGRCVAADGRAGLVPDGARDLVAALVVPGAAGGKSTTLVATAPNVACDEIMPRESTAHPPWPCAAGGVTRPHEASPELALAFPAVPLVASPARVAVFRRASPATTAGMLARLATEPCDRLCGDPAGPDGLAVCIDTLFAPVGLEAGALVYAPDLVKCELMTKPTPIPWNDFGELCEVGTAGSTLPACKGLEKELSLWEDECHNVYVPFDWTNVRRTSPTAPDAVDRVVRGQSAISQRGQVEGGRVWVPGREYVGTLAEADLDPGDSFATDPRKAAIDVWYPSPVEVGLQGVVDKDHSIVHVVPRLAASYVCDDRSASGASDEACMRVATQPALDATRCACTDRYRADCTCTTLSKGRFFECSGSGMPCTRHDHCNPGETCSVQPTCQAKGTVWASGGVGPAGGGKCWTDKDCETDAARPQCGYLLFDVGKKREPSSNVVKLAKSISPTGPRKGRGACKNTSGSQRKACSNGSGAAAPGACAPADGDCVGYVLEALGAK